MDQKLAGIVIIFLILSFAISGVDVSEIIAAVGTNAEVKTVKPPAEIYCDHKGGLPQIVYNIYGGSNKVCIFNDGSECLQDDFFNLKCHQGDLPTVKPVIYFANQKLDPSGAECGLVYPVKYAVGKYQNWENLTLQKLLLGPNEEQIKQGYLTLINPEAKLISFKLENGVAKLDFSKEIKKDIKTDCQKTILKNQIEQTLEQFGSINLVEITIDGEASDFLEI